ncbi:MAG: ECF transporter S component [Candidatus Brockarchaeota archaeon]|nr:ECF transporter S component [Candidatus Brockarchaeota archaeon]
MAGSGYNAVSAPTAKTGARTAVSFGLGTAFVAVLTMAFRLDIPATKGYFNLGDAAIFICALLMGPAAGAFAGGVGSAIADVVGYPVFAPGTLAVKGIEGFLAGALYERMRKGGSRKTSVAIAGILLALGAAISLAVSALGSEMAIALGYPFAQFSIVGVVGLELWAILVTVFGLALAYVALRKGEPSSATIACAVAGLEMVAGYFAYEHLLLALGILPGIVPIAEVFPNLAQALIGTAVAVPSVGQVLKARKP